MSKKKDKAYKKKLIELEERLNKEAWAKFWRDKNRFMPDPIVFIGN